MADQNVFSFKIQLILILIAFIFSKIREIASEESKSCDTAPIPTNGEVERLEHIDDAKVAYYKCNDRYTLEGNEYRVCMPGMGWSGWNKCRPPPTTPTTTLSHKQKEMKTKMKNIVHDVEEVGETPEGKELLVAVGAAVLMVLLLAVHCGRAAATRKSLKTKYDDVVKAGDTPRKQLPSFCEVSNDVFKTTFCCQDSGLPKSFKPKKDKKRNKDKAYRDNDELDLRSDHNMNSSMPKMRSREKYFRSEIGLHGDTCERSLINKLEPSKHRYQSGYQSMGNSYAPRKNKHVHAGKVDNSKR